MPSFDGPGVAPQRASPAWAQMVDRLFSRARLGMVLGLERIARVLERLGHPERSFPSIHVAGTNGKGSTSAFLASILSQRPGRRIGLYTSPHLAHVNERVQIVEGSRFTPLSEEALLAALQAVEEIAPDFGDLTFFEVLTAGSLLALARAGVDAAVIEAGIGAKLDATRMVDAEVSVLTDLSLEHTAILGTTLEAIALDKSFVMRPGRPLVYAGSTPAVDAVVLGEALRVGSAVFRLGRDLRAQAEASGRLRFELAGAVVPEVELALAGPHQTRNALLAAQAARLFDPSVEPPAIAQGLARAVWRGRFERIERPGLPLLLLDGAHNPQGIEALVGALIAEGARLPARKHLVFAALDDKDVASMLGPLLPVVDSVIVTRPQGQSRARDPAELTALLPGAQAIEPVPAALAEAEARAQRDGGFVLVAGSLYLVGEVLRRLERG